MVAATARMIGATRSRKVRIERLAIERAPSRRRPRGRTTPNREFPGHSRFSGLTKISRNWMAAQDRTSRAEAPRGKIAKSQNRYMVVAELSIAREAWKETRKFASHPRPIATRRR